MWRGMPYRQVFDDPGSGRSVVSGNRWDQPLVPHKGWHCVDVVDLRADGESADETNATKDEAKLALFDDFWAATQDDDRLRASD